MGRMLPAGLFHFTRLPSGLRLLKPALCIYDEFGMG